MPESTVLAESQSPDESPKKETTRRSFLQKAGGLSLTGALIAAYGGFAAIIARFLFPAEPQTRAWIFVREVAALDPDSSFTYRLPNGAPVTISRRGSGISADDFRALSSTCPHLGCQVHWESQNNRFFCPCHNGVFDPSGKAIAGPPADAGQALVPYPLEIRDDLLFIEVPIDESRSQSALVGIGPKGAGAKVHEDCAARKAEEDSTWA